MQCAVRLMEMIMPRLSYINPVSCLNQFKEVLELQVDLRNEAKALKVSFFFHLFSLISLILSMQEHFLDK